MALRYDAIPEVIKWEVHAEYALFVGRHRGYQRSSNSVLPERVLLMDFVFHALYLEDRFIGEGEHLVVEPLHLAPGVKVEETGEDELLLLAADWRFRLRWGALRTTHCGSRRPVYRRHTE